MFRKHLLAHGLTYGHHFRNNAHLTWLALKSAFYTLGHGIVPIISGRRASELHNEIWESGREMSLADLRHRLRAGLYANQQEALLDHQAYSVLYNENPLMKLFEKEINNHYR